MLKRIYLYPEGFTAETHQQESNSKHLQLIRNIDFRQISFGKLFKYRIPEHDITTSDQLTTNDP